MKIKAKPHPYVVLIGLSIPVAAKTGSTVVLITYTIDNCLDLHEVSVLCLHGLPGVGYVWCLI